MRSARSISALALVGSLVGSLAGGCSPAAVPPPVPVTPGPDAATSSGSMVFGVTSELRAGIDVGSVRIEQRVASKVTTTRTLRSTDPTPLAFPFEVRFDGLADETPVAITLDAFLPSALPTSAPLLSRIASSKIVRSRVLLERVTLQAACVPPVVGGGGGDAAAPEGGIGGGPLPCAAPATCENGACADPFQDPQFADPYTPEWNRDRPDPPCKPVLTAPPEVIVGEGQSDYGAVADLETVQVEKGPQGGHHIWIAIRVKNLHRSGSRTTVTAVQPDTQLVVQPYETIFTFDPDEGGYCKLYGLRFQLDAGGVDYTQMLGKELDVTVTVTDTSGDIGKGTKRVTLSPTTI